MRSYKLSTLILVLVGIFGLLELASAIVSNKPKLEMPSYVLGVRSDK